MSRASAIWDQVDLLAEQGKAPVIKISPSAEVREPKRRPGRPRQKREGAPEAAHWSIRTPAGYRMTCRASGCQKKLRKGQIVCSRACEDAVREECVVLLAILDGKLDPSELPPHLRTRRLRRKRTL